MKFSIAVMLAALLATCAGATPPESSTIIPAQPIVAVPATTALGPSNYGIPAMSICALPCSSPCATVGSTCATKSASCGSCSSCTTKAVSLLDMRREDIELFDLCGGLRLGQAFGLFILSSAAFGRELP